MMPAFPLFLVFSIFLLFCVMGLVKFHKNEKRTHLRNGVKSHWFTSEKKKRKKKNEIKKMRRKTYSFCAIRIWVSRSINGSDQLDEVVSYFVSIIFSLANAKVNMNDERMNWTEQCVRIENIEWFNQHTLSDIWCFPCSTTINQST